MSRIRTGAVRLRARAYECAARCRCPRRLIRRTSTAARTRRSRRRSRRRRFGSVAFRKCVRGGGRSRRSLVLGSWCVVRPWSLVRPSSLVPPARVCPHGPGTKDNGRTKNKERRTTDHQLGGLYWRQLVALLRDGIAAATRTDG